MLSKEDLIAVFEDTEKWYQTDATLKDAVQASIQGTKFYKEGDIPALPQERDKKAQVLVNRNKTLEYAYIAHKKLPNAKITIHNFASATHPGGGVRKGSRAQEECLCRTTTLLPVLETETNKKAFYDYHWSRHDVRYTDACIYTPGIVAVKTDDDLPRRLPQEDWMKLDVITCAAPNLRAMPSNSMNRTSGKAIKMKDEDLMALHEKRARHLLSIAAANGTDVLILGAFGCGAFQNNPNVVAQAYANVLPDFLRQFVAVVFAVYCTERDRSNYVAFYNKLSKVGR